MKSLTPLALLLLLTQVASCSHQAESSNHRAPEATNYNDCILQHMKGIGSDLAARAIDEACAAKFGDSEPPKETSL